MNLKTKLYTEQLELWPPSGYHIMAQYNDQEIIVYQAYRPAIGNFASKHQYFGGPFSLDRMTWIKPNFLWMMFRSGWGQKEGQEVVLAVHLKMSAFIHYLQEAEYSSFSMSGLKDKDAWSSLVKESDSRLQWDPDHDPYGGKLDRRAIQIGIRNDLIASYCKDDILEIEDISPFVNEQYQKVKEHDLESLMVSEERPLLFDDDKLNMKLKLK